MAKPQLASRASQLAETAELGYRSHSESSELPSPSPSADVSHLSYGRLFSSSPQPILVVDTRWVIVHANVAACRLLGASKAALLGAPILDFLRSGSGSDVVGSLMSARLEGSSKLTDIRASVNGTALKATVSLVKSAGREYLLVHPRPITDRADDLENPSLVSEAIENASVGFLVTDGELKVLYANRAFLHMTGLACAAQAVGCPLTRWLKLSSDDFAQLSGQMNARESVTGLVKPLRDGSGRSRLVHALAIAVPDGPQSRWGFTLTEHARVN